MVGGNESFNHSAASPTTTSFTDDAETGFTRDGAKRYEVADADEHGLLRRTATNITEERPGENVTVASSSGVSLLSAGPVDMNSTANRDSTTYVASPDVPSTSMVSHDQDSVGLNGAQVASQQAMEALDETLHRPSDRAAINGPTQSSDVVNHVTRVADGESNVTNDGIIAIHTTSDTTPESSTALPQPVVGSAPASNNSTTSEMLGTTTTTTYDDGYHDTYNDDDDSDDDYGGHYDDYLHNGSLIEPSDLLGFTHDRLPLVVPGNAGIDGDDISGTNSNTEKFYISDDDEFSIGDAMEEDRSVPDTTDDIDMDVARADHYPRNIDTGNEASFPDQSLTGANLPSPRGDDENLEEDEIDDDGDDDDYDLGTSPIYRDSTAPDFLQSAQLHSSSSSSPEHFISRDVRLVFEGCGNARHVMSGLVDTPELAATFVKTLPSGLFQPRIQNILGNFSLSRNFISSTATARRGIFVQQSGHALAAVLRGMGLSDMSACLIPISAFERRRLLFDIHSSSPATAMRNIPTYIHLSGGLCDCAALDKVSRPAPPAVREDAAAFAPSRPLLSEAQYEEIHRRSENSSYFIEPSLILKAFDSHTASSLLATPLAPSEDEMYSEANGISFPALERNLTFSQFIRQWFVRSHVTPAQHGLNKPSVPIAPEAAKILDWRRPPKISRPEDHPCAHFDIQGIPWHQKLKVSRFSARVLRDHLYRSYHNLKYQPHGYASTLPQTEGYFQAKTMYTKHKAAMEHFQLRNLMSVTASNTLQYSCRSRIYSITPFYEERHCLMDFSNPSSSSRFLDPVRITTMKAKHGVTVAGGFAGEYAFRGDISDHTTVEGFVTRELDGITTHVDVVKHRTNDYPQVVISSNDGSIRTLDCETNTFIYDHKFVRPINCTDTSPDGRLRVVVGDAPDAWVVDTESGKPLQSLSGHRDFGFACAWSPDMLHIATSNQDKTVNIWDARMWRPLQTIDSDVACYRSLRFSPVGGGPRTLLMCEPADRISIVSAQTYQTRQVHDFFGEIGGADFSPDGRRIWVANMDPEFGGFMEFDRRQWGQEFGIGHTRRRRIEYRGDMYYPDLPNEWLPEADLDNDERCVLGPGERKLRYQGTLDDDRHAIHPFLG